MTLSSWYRLHIFPRVLIDLGRFLFSPKIRTWFGHFSPLQEMTAVVDAGLESGHNTRGWVARICKADNSSALLLALWRASPHCIVVNLVRSGRKQPQLFSASAGGWARHPFCSHRGENEHENAFFLPDRSLGNSPPFSYCFSLK
jgi:hypothetical protein